MSRLPPAKKIHDDRQLQETAINRQVFMRAEHELPRPVDSSVKNCGSPLEKMAALQRPSGPKGLRSVPADLIARGRYVRSRKVSLRTQPLVSGCTFPSISTYAFASAFTGSPSCLGLRMRSRPIDQVTRRSSRLPK